MPSASIRCRISIFCSIVGVRTDGDCNPSRSVSSSSITTRRLRRRADLVPVVDQGIDHEGQTSVLPLLPTCTLPRVEDTGPGDQPGNARGDSRGADHPRPEPVIE